MYELDIFNIMSGGWMSNPDPTAAGSLEFLPDVENFAPTYEGSLVLSQGYEDCGLSIPDALSGKPVVCLLSFERPNGIVCLLRAGGGGLWLDEIVTAGEVETDDGATGYSYA